MEIIYIFNGRLPTEKAHGLQIVKMCEAFAEDGNQVTLLSSYRRNFIKEDIFSFYSLKKNFVYHRAVGLDISWISGRVVYYYIQTLLSAFILVLRARRYQGQGVIFYARDYWALFFLSFFGMHPVAEIHDYRFKKPRWFIQFIFNKSKKIIVNSKGTKELLLNHYTFLESKILIAPNGVDLVYFDIPESREDARKKLGIPTGTILGYTGRLETVGMDKGVGLLIEAVNTMRHKETLLYIVGGPNNQVEHFKEKVRKLGLDKQIIFTGQVAHTLIPKYLRAMDIVVIPLDSNQHALTTSPIKLFEYMAAGKVIISSDLLGLREIISSSETVFFKPGDAHDLANQIDKVISDPELAKRLSVSSLNKAQQYSWLNRAQIIKKFILSDANHRNN